MVGVYQAFRCVSDNSGCYINTNALDASFIFLSATLFTSYGAILSAPFLICFVLKGTNKISEYWLLVFAVVSWPMMYELIGFLTRNDGVRPNTEWWFILILAVGGFLLYALSKYLLIRKAQNA